MMLTQAAPPLPVVLVLASGRGERFLASGGQVHKLRALLDGKPVLERTLDAVRASGLPWHLEDVGHPGMGDSIAAAVRATQDAAGAVAVGVGVAVASSPEQPMRLSATAPDPLAAAPSNTRRDNRRWSQRRSPVSMHSSVFSSIRSDPPRAMITASQ